MLQPGGTSGRELALGSDPDEEGAEEEAPTLTVLLSSPTGDSRGSQGAADTPGGPVSQAQSGLEKG